MVEGKYVGILAIGDPHVEGRVPGFRKDDYPRVVLEKLGWSLRYAREHSLLPVVLGDLFHLPRDNPNWVLGELLTLLSPPVIALYGNHDCHQDTLTDDDSFSLLLKADRLRMPDASAPWMGRMNGRRVFIGATPWGGWLPTAFDPASFDKGEGVPLVFWLSHHDVKVPGYEEQGHFSPRAIPGVDVVINGHIHRKTEDVQAGTTLWITPGNISRRARGDASRRHVPAVLRIDVSESGWKQQMVEVPHRPFDDVFYEEVANTADSLGASAFVAGLAELQSRRTDAGAGLMAFLEKNVSQFEPEVATEIIALGNEVTNVQKK